MYVCIYMYIYTIYRKFTFLCEIIIDIYGDDSKTLKDTKEQLN